MTTRFPSSSGSARVSEVPGLHIRLPRARPQPVEAPPQPLEPRLHPQAPSLPGTQAAGSQSTNSAQRPESRALPSHWNIEPIPKGPSRPSETFPLTPSPVFKGPTTGNSLHLRTLAHHATCTHSPRRLSGQKTSCHHGRKHNVTGVRSLRGQVTSFRARRSTWGPGLASYLCM